MDVASTSFILGYHGCDKHLAERVLAGKASLLPSHNDYDWLADGIYFWEHNARRAFEYASEIARFPHPSGQMIKIPAVIGAVIDLGHCLNLLDTRYIETVRIAFDQTVVSLAATGTTLPRNTGPGLRSRNLDCAVLRTLHTMRAESGARPFDSVRAAFIEGDPLYTNAGFAAKSHIQVCVRETRQIKGYFRPLDDEGRPIAFA